MSDEEHARRVVTIMKQAHVRPGEVMTLSTLSDEWQKPQGAHPEDLISGLDFARRQIWIERAGDHAVRLTANGSVI
jgi:hypothetical protein